MSGSLERFAPYVGHALGLTPDAVLRAYRPACEADIPQILALRQRVNGAMWWDDRAFVEWRYFSRRTDTGDPAYWVFVRDGEVLAACGIEPVTLVVDGTSLPAVRTLDIMVRPDLDGIGLGALMNLVLFDRFPIALVTGSNARSHALLMRMFRHTTELRFWKTAIRSRALVEERFGGPVSALVSWVADPLLALWRLFHRVGVPPGISIRELTAFDSRVVDLSRRCEIEGRVLVRRCDELLNWRFVQNPRCQHRLLGAFRGDRLEGYLITRFNRGRRNPRREAELVDWLTAPDEPGARPLLPALVQVGLDELARDGAAIVSCATTSAGVEAAMTATGFRYRPGEQLPFFVKAADPKVEERLSRGGGWFLTRGDHDVE